MKKTIKLLMVVTFFIAGCGGDDSSSNNFFYSAIKEISPTISASASQIQASEIPTGSILREIYDVLRDYEFPADEGVIDMHNIYKVIHTAGQIYTNAETSCSTITEQEISSPYDLGITGVTYNCAGNSGTMSETYANGFAIKELEGVKYGLLTYRWAPNTPTQEEHGVLQGNYNESTGDISVRMVHHVYYSDQVGMVVRSHITGNEQTHAFTISMISSGTDLTNWTSIVGKGISEGTGNYFLFKVNTSSGVDGNYFCFPADATETTLEEMHAADSDGSGSVNANCADYQTDVDDMTFLTTSDVPTELSSFTGSTILLSY